MTEFLTIAEASRLIAARKLSPVELATTCLERIKAVDPVLNAFLLVTEERALADAKAAETRVMSGAAKGPLDGIPIAHKDIYNTAGIRTTAHSKLLEDNVPTADSTVVRQWAEAGTVMLGKLATHEFAMGGPSFDLPWPPARNPWNADHFPAGSSSGTGAAVAAGMIMGGTGSDTGGSIRGPSALCGIAGIKPTYCSAPACCSCPSRWITPARWLGRWRIARCCCRRSPVTIRPIRPAPRASRPTTHSASMPG
ncbi:MAG: hypothetical protein J0H99_01355 [Rhodospirillales bacterium]|nr:hypothetical protein [Rhodospirillales bacterium]